MIQFVKLVISEQKYLSFEGLHVSHIIEMNSILLSNKRVRTANCSQIPIIERIFCQTKLDERTFYLKHYKDVV